MQAQRAPGGMNEAATVLADANDGSSAELVRDSYPPKGGVYVLPIWVDN